MPDLLKINDLVKGLLIKHPHLRDDNFKLTATVWKYEAKNQCDIITKDEFLFAYASGKFTLADSITRVSRKIQQENPNLRGSLWEERQGLKKETINQLNQIF